MNFDNAFRIARQWTDRGNYRFVLMTNIGSPGRFGVDLDVLFNAVAR